MHPPNDVRHFVHKRIFKGVSRFVTSGFNPVAAAGGFLEGADERFARPSRRRGGAPTAPARRNLGRRRGTRALAGGGCPAGRTPVRGRCVKVSAILPGGVPFTTGRGGVAVMGQFGAGLSPEQESVTVHRCLPGMVLGKDMKCYNRKDISNRERKWPRGRRPLGTPSELAALAKAASFGRRMESTVKRMQKIGVLKKPRRGAPRARPQRLLGPGGPSIINVE